MSKPTIPGLVYFTEELQQQRHNLKEDDVVAFVHRALTFKLPQIIQATLSEAQLEALVTAVHGDMVNGYKTLEMECSRYQWFHVLEAIDKVRVVQVDIVNAVTQLGKGVNVIEDINWRV